MKLLYLVKKNRELMKFNDYLNSLNKLVYRDICDTSYYDGNFPILSINNKTKEIYISVNVFKISQISDNDVVEIIKNGVVIQIIKRYYD